MTNILRLLTQPRRIEERKHAFPLLTTTGIEVDAFAILRRFFINVLAFHTILPLGISRTIQRIAHLRALRIQQTRRLQSAANGSFLLADVTASSAC